jgi:hypothetical protein
MSDLPVLQANVLVFDPWYLKQAVGTRRNDVGREEDGSRRNSSAPRRKHQNTANHHQEPALAFSLLCHLVAGCIRSPKSSGKVRKRGCARIAFHMQPLCQDWWLVRAGSQRSGTPELLSLHRSMAPEPLCLTTAGQCRIASQVRASSNWQLGLFVTCVDYLRLLKQAMRRSTAQPATTSLISPLFNPPASSTFFALKQASALSSSSP